MLEHQVQRSDYGINCINGFPWEKMFWKKCPRGAHRLFAAQLSQTANKLAEIMRLEGQRMAPERYFQFH